MSELTPDRGYKSRKFLLAVFALGSATTLVVLGLLDGGQWVMSTGGTLALYFAGNVGQKAVTSP